MSDVFSWRRFPILWPRACFLGIVINDLARFVDCNPTSAGAADMSPGLLWNTNHVSLW